MLLLLSCGRILCCGGTDGTSFRPEFDIHYIPLARLAADAGHHVENIVLFLPFGFLLPTLWAGFEKGYRTVLAGFLFSLAIELSQLFCFRDTDIDDLLMNTLGAAAGFGLFLTAKKLFPGAAALLRRGPPFPRWEAGVYIALMWLTAALLQPFLSLWMWGFAP